MSRARALVSSLFIFAAIAPVFPAQVWSQTSNRISVFVGPNARDGFIDVDQGILDSMRDIQAEIGRSTILTLTQDRAAAKIVLTVLGRRTSGTAGAVGITTPGTTIGGGTIAGVPQPTFTTPGVTTLV